MIVGHFWHTFKQIPDIKSPILLHSLSVTDEEFKNNKQNYHFTEVNKFLNILISSPYSIFQDYLKNVFRQLVCSNQDPNRVHMLHLVDMAPKYLNL